MPASCGSSRARIIPGTDHGFAQVWFILKGEFTIDGKLCWARPGAAEGQCEPAWLFVWLGYKAC